MNKVECDLHGVRMPELRSGARRSKRVDDLYPTQQPVDQGDNWLLPAQNRTRRRVGGGRGRGGGNATGVAKGPSLAAPTRPTAAGRGRGIRLIDLDPEPCEVLPEAVAVGTGEPPHNQVEVVADIGVGMEGGSGDKVNAVEEEASTTPVPERVRPAYLFLVPGSLVYLEILYLENVYAVMLFSIFSGGSITSPLDPIYYIQTTILIRVILDDSSPSSLHSSYPTRNE